MRPVRGTGSSGRVVLTALLVLVIAGVLGGIGWYLAVDLPSYTRTADSGAMEALQLSHAVSIDGWFAVIGAGLALLLGAGLAGWAGAHPRSTVLGVALGGLAGGLAMLTTGRLLGPGPLEPRLAAAPEGELVPVQLVPGSGTVDVIGWSVHAIVLVWPIAALVGVVLVFLLSPAPFPDRADG